MNKQFKNRKKLNFVILTFFTFLFAIISANFGTINSSAQSDVCLQRQEVDKRIDIANSLVVKEFDSC